MVGAYDSETEARNLITYMKTLFFRFFVSQFMYSHHITKDAYSFVPVLNMKHKWTDAKLYKRYALTREEIEFICSKVRSMEQSDESTILSATP